ncbi:DUF4407 domain-containing protein, partial [Tsukamurella soli]|uniref:DUF4407 domain-containing protein n=1 Tax=Tsukamurella soli TaxID=644556 RepID=UPI0031E61DBE
PEVQDATAALAAARSARAAVDTAVTQASTRRDQALVVARCEYRPTAACPQTRITGVPGEGPETRTADSALAQAQAALDAAQAAQTGRAPALDATVAAREHDLAVAQASAVAARTGGLGTRWLAMNQLSGSAQLLRIAIDAVAALVAALPLLVRRWRDETEQDRAGAVRAVQGRADAAAEEAIATANAAARAEVGTMWAEREVEHERIAAAAETEIVREEQRRRLADAVDSPTIEFYPDTVRVSARRTIRPVDPALDAPRRGSTLPPAHAAADTGYLPIAAAAEAASLAATAEPTDDVKEPVTETRNLPATVAARTLAAAPARESGGLARPEADAGKPNPFLPPIVDDVARAASRWVRPLVPPIIARAIDTTTHPLRSARHAFEEVEEITFSLRRVRRVTVEDEQGGEPIAPGHPADWARSTAWTPAEWGAYDVDPRSTPVATGHAGLDAAQRAGLAGHSRDALAGGRRHLPRGGA